MQYFCIPFSDIAALTTLIDLQLEDRTGIRRIHALNFTLRQSQGRRVHVNRVSPANTLKNGKKNVGRGNTTGQSQTRAFIVFKGCN